VGAVGRGEGATRLGERLILCSLGEEPLHFLTAGVNVGAGE